MIFKKIPFDYDWKEIISRLNNDDEYEDMSNELDDDILKLKDMEEIPWVELPSKHPPMMRTGLYVQDEGEGYIGCYIVYKRRKIYYSEFKEDYSDLINESNEMCNLTLSTRNGRPLFQYSFYNIKENEVEEIQNMIEDESVDELWDYLLTNKDPFNQTIVFNLYDDKEDFLDYDLNDETGEEIDSGQFRVLRKNIINWGLGDNIINREVHPKYLLITSDLLKDGQTSFEVPKCKKQVFNQQF